MPVTPLSEWTLQRPILSLTMIFIFWKTTLFLIAACSPGIGYDTSTDLLLSEDLNVNSSTFTKSLPNVVILVKKLVRWDAFYYVSIAKNGYTFEQEWAFGAGFPITVKILEDFISRTLGLNYQVELLAILIATSSHFLAVICLYLLCRERTGFDCGEKISFMSAMFLILAPAGIFLSAPYSESLFAVLSIGGYYCYAKSLDYQDEQRQPYQIISLLGAGLIFGLAATVRSNGIFTGLIFLFDLAELSLNIIRTRKIGDKLIRAVSVVLAGLFVGAGFTFPQYIAHKQFCQGNSADQAPREWCTKTLPSIYGFVQQHYWGNGFLRYWTISNVPLFAISLPMLTMMILSAKWAFEVAWEGSSPNEKRRKSLSNNGGLNGRLMMRLALPQSLLTILAVTNSHVQIITRLASAYPLPYIWLASSFVTKQAVMIAGRSINLKRLIFQTMVMYALIQAGLFASFLPPA